MVLGCLRCPQRWATAVHGPPGNDARADSHQQLARAHPSSPSGRHALPNPAASDANRTDRTRKNSTFPLPHYLSTDASVPGTPDRDGACCYMGGGTCRTPGSCPAGARSIRRIAAAAHLVLAPIAPGPRSAVIASVAAIAARVPASCLVSHPSRSASTVQQHARTHSEVGPHTHLAAGCPRRSTDSSRISELPAPGAHPKSRSTPPRAEAAYSGAGALLPPKRPTHVDHS